MYSKASGLKGIIDINIFVLPQTTKGKLGLEHIRRIQTSSEPFLYLFEHVRVDTGRVLAWGRRGMAVLMHGLVRHGDEATLPYSVKWQNILYR